MIGVLYNIISDVNNFKTSNHSYIIEYAKYVNYIIIYFKSISKIINFTNIGLIISCEQHENIFDTDINNLEKFTKFDNTKLKTYMK